MNFKKQISRVTLVLVLLTVLDTLSSYGQAKKPTWIEKNPNFKIDPFMMVQLWGVQTIGMRADLDGDGTFEDVENRFNIHLRRARLGFRANPYSWLNFTLVTFYDGVGKDELNASFGPSEVHDVGFGIWDAFFHAKLSDSESLIITGGYFRPQLGRESITSSFATTSGDKAIQQNYIRFHLTGIGSGRTPGINVGGLLFNDTEGFQINYNAGIFNPVVTTDLPGGQNSVGTSAAPLFVGRTVFNFGDPEMSKYTIGYKSNYYNERYGLSIGLGGSYQGETGLFDLNTSLSADFLLNWGPLNIDGDWHLLSREGGDKGVGGLNVYNANTGHIRASYNILVDGKILEPTVMWMQYNGAEEAMAQKEAHAVGSFSGSNDTYNVGFNFYQNTHRLKWIAHYVIQQGTPGRNQWTGQQGLSIQRGNYFVIGLNAIF
ncbi:hypothetical protein [Marivirga harenae]|uniref:hypothetical protein n=1 Tax=Marivirga harenae TaxID=2010992 RepID=UPI0026E0885F|nr:hypothetical protein [Marivirga harenae]WKV12434.1 hypothetical protein Q3Y49_01115 [Marivirga harenae]